MSHSYTVDKKEYKQISIDTEYRWNLTHTFSEDNLYINLLFFKGMIFCQDYLLLCLAIYFAVSY